MQRQTTGVILVNLGTPDSASVRDVRRYLREFLWDPRVLDLPTILRALLLYGFILPFRPRRSAEAYRKIWTERGSPLKFHSEDLARKVGQRLGDRVTVEVAMRYQNPSVARALASMRAKGIDSIVALPMFPQYSSAAWGSAVEKIYREAVSRWHVPAIQVIPPFYNQHQFIEALADIARPLLNQRPWDKVLMSFHGLPERHCTKTDATGTLCHQQPDCCDQIVTANRNCYRAQCFATARALAARLELTPLQWHIGFQSRLGRTPWIKPYTDHVIDDLARSGAKHVAVLEPSFTADCLETLEEIQIRGKEQFVAAGGTDLWLVPTLNSTDQWADAVTAMVRPFLDNP